MPRPTQNDKREQTGRIPGQLEQVQRQTPNVYGTPETLDVSQQGQIQYGADAPSAYRTNPSLATELVRQLEPAAKITGQVIEIRKRIEEEKLQDIQRLAQNTMADNSLTPMAKYKIIGDAYGDFNPLSKKGQIIAHTQKTKAMQQLNGIENELEFSDWSTQTLKKGLTYAVSPENGMMSREMFYRSAATEYAKENPAMAAKTEIWFDGQQQQVFKKQYDNLNTFANTSADIILKGMLENPTANFEQAGSYNVFQATLSESLSSNGIDPKSVLENQSIMEGIQYKYESNRVLGTQVTKIRSDRDRVVSRTTNSVMNGISSGPIFDSNSVLGPSAVARVITQEAPNTTPLNPIAYLSKVNSQLSSISSEINPAQMATNLSQYPVGSYSEQYQDLIKNIHENPDYLTDVLEDPKLLQQVKGALYETESLFRQDLMLAAGDELKLAFVNPTIENAATPPSDLIPGASKTEKIMATVTSTDYPDDAADQKRLIKSAAEEEIALLELQQFQNLSSDDYTIQEDPVFEIAGIKNLLDEANLGGEEINLEATNKLVNLLERKINTPENISRDARSTSFFLKTAKSGVPLGGDGEQTAGRVIPALIFSYTNAFSEENPNFLSEAESFFTRALDKFVINLPEGSSLRSEFTEVLQNTELFSALEHIEDRVNNLIGTKSEEWKVDFKTKYGEFVTDLAKWTERKTRLITVNHDDSFSLSNNTDSTRYLSGIIASGRQRDMTTGVTQSHISEEAINIFVGRLDNLSEKMLLNSQEEGGQFDLEKFKNEERELFAAVTNITASGPTIQNKKLKKSVARFQATSIGLPSDMTTRIINEDNLLTKDGVVKDTLIRLGPMISELPVNRRNMLRDTILTFQSFFPSSNESLPPNVYSPENLVDRSNISIADPSNPRSMAREAFGLNIGGFGDSLSDPVTGSAKGFMLEVQEAVIRGALSDRSIFAAFRDSGENVAALQTAMQENIQEGTTGINVDLGSTATDIIFNSLQQKNMAVSVSLVRVPKGQGNKEATKLAKLHLIENVDDLADKKLDDLDYEYGFETQIIPNTSGSSQVIRVNRFDPQEEERFKSQLTQEFGITDGNVANINASRANTVVPLGGFYFMEKQFKNLLGGSYSRGFQGGADPDPYADVVRIAATERGSATFVGGRSSVQSGQEVIEEGMSLFGLDQVITLYAVAEQMQIEGLSGLDFLKDIYDQHSRTSQSGVNSLIAYQSSEGEMILNTDFSIPLVLDERVQTRINALREIALNSNEVRVIPEESFTQDKYFEFRTARERKQITEAEELQKANQSSFGRGLIPGRQR